MGIPRNDLPQPRETSPLSPIRNSESLSRQWIAVAKNAKRALAFGNKISQLDNRVQRLGLAGFPSISFSLFTMISDGGDFIVCYQNSTNTDVGFMPATSGNQINVYKPFELRTSLTTETINGVVYDYTYTPQGSPVMYYQRAVTGSDSSSETDVVIPYYLPTRPIWAVQDSAGNWVDINRAGRAWAAINQGGG
jgi:hypothetical protein